MAKSSVKREKEQCVSLVEAVTYSYLIFRGTETQFQLDEAGLQVVVRSLSR